MLVSRTLVGAALRGRPNHSQHAIIERLGRPRRAAPTIIQVRITIRSSRLDFFYGVDQAFDLFFGRVAGAAGADQAFGFEAEALNHRVCVEVAVREEESFLCETACGFS